MIAAVGKRRKETAKIYGILGLFTLAACWLFVGRHRVFGVKVDWLSQHSVFPDYFRQQFYETGKLFPEFAGNLGGGQNVYYFSYYGLYNPVILLSYCLPFVKMGDYLMAASIAGIYLSICLFYYWLGKRGISQEIRLAAAILFLLAGPMIFQASHQIMFVNYMPFLCMALIGVDRYFEKGKPGVYTISVFLMIMTSFYYSIGGMLALTLYGLFRYMEGCESPDAGSIALRYRTKIQRGRYRIRSFLKAGCGFFLPMATAVCMSGILLVPTAYAILGRRQAKGADIRSFLIPRFPIESLVHGAYGTGLSTVVITVLLVGCVYRKWSERLLHISCLLIVMLPFFSWLLNGGLYVRGKTLIPFLPLFCYLTAVYLEKLKKKELSFGVNAVAYFLTICWLCVGHYWEKELAGGRLCWYLILAESILLFICFLVYWKWGGFWLMAAPSILCLALSGSFFYGAAKEALDQKTYDRITDVGTGRLIETALEGEKGLFRLEQGGSEGDKSANINRIWDVRQWISSVYSSAYNEEYQNFRKNIFGTEEPFRNELMQAASENPLYQKLMGVKYVVKDSGCEKAMAAAGYEPWLTEGGLTVYRSGDTAPIAYATDQLVSESDYDKLTFPYNQIAMMKYAVTAGSRDKDASWEEEAENLAVPAAMSIPVMETEDLVIQSETEGSYHIQAQKKTELSCRITGDDRLEAAESDLETSGSKAAQSQTGRILFVQFRVNNLYKKKDVEIWLNDTRNKLSAKNHIYYNGNTTFTYAAALEAGKSDVELIFGKGDYEISELKCFLGDQKLLEDAEDLEHRLYQSPLQADWEQTKGNQIRGKIQVRDTGYLITSIPYDSGFEILVDGKRTAPEKVNKAFLGCSISKGRHQVEIRYHAPGVTAGKALSCIGVFLLAILILSSVRRKRLPMDLTELKNE